MSLGALPFAESTLAGSVHGLAPAGGGGGPEPPPVLVAPFSLEVGGVVFAPLMDSLSMESELGRQGTASFTLVNINAVPSIGQPVRIKFYEQVLFAGSLDRLVVESNSNQSVTRYACECVDHSHLLARRKVSRQFTNASLSTIANALLADELSNDGITLGTVGHFPAIPIVDADNVSVYDLLSETSVTVGAFSTIDHEKKLHFLGSDASAAPMPIDDTIVQTCRQTFDRETFRNKQTVVVTGTPVVQNDQPLTITYTAVNGNQIPQQAVIEGTSGTYNEIAAIKHPTSNFTQDLLKLGLAYAKTLLALRGSLRETLTIRTRQSGFQIGMLVPVNLPKLAIAGNWMIHRVSLLEEAGQFLVTEMELSTASLRARAQELWLDVVRKGKVRILPPTAITSNLQTYSTPGTYQFVVPPGTILAQVTCAAPGGGGGGGARSTFSGYPERFAAGGPGGRGGLCISVLDVTPGETLTITVPTGGFGGTSVQQLNQSITAVGVNGGHGGDAKVDRTGGFTVCLAYGGRGGIGAQANARQGFAIGHPKSADGSGLFGVVTAGAGRAGGGGGNGNPLVNGMAGEHGRVTVEW